MTYRVILAGWFIGLSLFARDTKMRFDQLPAAVQTSAKANSVNAQIIGAAKEIENGQTTYEVETKLHGMSRDLSFDASGKLLAIEEETAPKALPAAAWAIIQKRAAGGTVKTIETVTAGNSVFYEAAILVNGKRKEIAVNADGTPHHDQ